MCSSSQNPAKTNKKKERRVSASSVWKYCSSSPSRSRSRRSTRKTFSRFLSLSLSVGKKYSLQEGTASDSFCAVYITAFQQLYTDCVIIVSIISFHQQGERERERSEISLARTRESALGDTKQKTSLLVHFFFVSKTDSYRYSLLSKPPHGSNRVPSL